MFSSFTLEFVRPTMGEIHFCIIVKDPDSNQILIFHTHGIPGKLMDWTSSPPHVALQFAWLSPQLIK